MKGERSKFYKPVLVLLIIGFMFSVSLTQKTLNASRASMGLTRLTPLENAPPVLAFTTVALGGFRGLIANALWIRANDLQEEGKYFEMVQLADWITKLQPHFTTVWIHQAWNMAYNISIKFSDPHERWLWVLRGIQLLRDQGLKFNPNEPLIYRELAWFFQHKLGAFLDENHNEYKQYWAADMNQVLGYNKAINFDELINPQTEDARRRSNLLREKYKMDPVWMKEVDNIYGPLEWHLPESHAIYWAYLGLEKTKNEKMKKDDFVQLRRVIFQSMQLAFMRGRLIYPDKNSTEFTYGPNLSIVKKASDTYLQMADLVPEMRDNILNGHKNFVRTAVYFLFTHNRMSAANEWFNYLRKQYPGSVPDNMTLDDYAVAKVFEDLGGTDPVRVRSELEGMIESSFLNYATGDEERGLGYERFAEKVWARYQEAVGKLSAHRVGLPPIADIRREVLKRMLEPDFGLDPGLLAQLRTRLGLPAAAPSTNSPAANPATATAPNPNPTAPTNAVKKP
jgi:hypothetical protein